MGILNVTPDSFSDGERFVAVEATLAHAQDADDLRDVGHRFGRGHRELRYPGAASVKTSVKLRPANVRMTQVVVIGWPSSNIISARSPLERSSESTSTPSQSKITRSMVNRLPDAPLRSSAAKTFHADIIVSTKGRRSGLP
jgi:hypothetical protein